jgi:hypothetical protein
MLLIIRLEAAHLAKQCILKLALPTTLQAFQLWKEIEDAMVDVRNDGSKIPILKKILDIQNNVNNDLL